MATEVGKFPAIVCAIRDVEGNLVTLHRTYLTQNGKKAKVGNAKKMMPIPDGLDVNGAAIRLGEPTEVSWVLQKGWKQLCQLIESLKSRFGQRSMPP